MTAYFQRQLADYVDYHRDPWNCAMHVLGIILLFLGAILPLSMWPISLFGAQTAVATLLVLPVLIYWVVLDPALGLAIVGVAALLLSTAAIIVAQASVPVVWIATAVLIVIGVTSQVVGHRVFERRQPDDRVLAPHPGALVERQAPADR